MKLNNIGDKQIDQLGTQELKVTNRRDVLLVIMDEFGIKAILEDILNSPDLISANDSQFNWKSCLELGFIIQMLGGELPATFLSRNTRLTLNSNVLAATVLSSKFLMATLFKILFNLRTIDLPISHESLDKGVREKMQRESDEAMFADSFRTAASLQILYPDQKQWHKLTEVAWQILDQDLPPQLNNWEWARNSLEVLCSARLVDPQRVEQFPLYRDIVANPQQILDLYQTSYSDYIGGLPTALISLTILCADRIELEPFRLIFDETPQQVDNSLSQQLVYGSDI